MGVKRTTMSDNPMILNQLKLEYHINLEKFGKELKERLYNEAPLELKLYIKEQEVIDKDQEIRVLTHLLESLRYQ